MSMTFLNLGLFPSVVYRKLTEPRFSRWAVWMSARNSPGKMRTALRITVLAVDVILLGVHGVGVIG